MTNIEYDINEHTHRYAVWTAARAVQRSFTTTFKIKNAIEKSGLRYLVTNSSWVTQDDFDEFHKKCAGDIIEAFKNNNSEKVNDNLERVSYGRAAKIIAIYLKTAVIVASGGLDKRCELIHPPIDRILLSNLSKLEIFKNINKDPWTQLTKDKYWEIVKTIRRSEHKFNWTLEVNWDTE